MNLLEKRTEIEDEMEVNDIVSHTLDGNDSEDYNSDSADSDLNAEDDLEIEDADEDEVCYILNMRIIMNILIQTYINILG